MWEGVGRGGGGNALKGGRKVLGEVCSDTVSLTREQSCIVCGMHTPEIGVHCYAHVV